MQTVINWLNSYPFSWFDGDGLTFVCLSLISAAMLAICCIKKLRNIFF